MQTLLVTGAAGFIGANLVRWLRRVRPDCRVVSFDALTYCGNVENLFDLRDDPGHVFVRGDVTDAAAVADVFARYAPDGVFHLAAESHVDRSILDPLRFVRTNVEGTAVLLRQAAESWRGRTDVRFLHVSTDEVFGSLSSDGRFTEGAAYAPNSPYSASKAASDHLVRAWHRTYGLPTLVTNCCNNFGPFQFPEKLIPVVVCRALANQPVPVYGQGINVRDWLFVDDHCAAIVAFFERGTPGETLCIGADNELTNLELVHRLLDLVDEETGRTPGSSRALVRFVTDRPGHDLRYAIDATRLRESLGWRPEVSLEDGLRRTVSWYLTHQDWCDRATSGAHREFERAWYVGRAGAP